MENAAFCTNCGAPVQNAPEQQANNPVQAENAIPNNQVQAVNANQPYGINQYQMPEENPKAQKKAKKQKSGKGKKAIIGIIIAVLVLAIAGVAVYFLFFNNKASDNKTAPVLYATENELILIDKLGSSPDQTKKITITDDYAGHYAFSENYDYIVYGENRDDDDGTFELYYKEVGKEDDPGTKIDNDVEFIDAVIGDIDKIIYSKNDCVYSSDKDGNSSKLAKDMDAYYLTKDKKSVICYAENESDDDDDYSYSYNVVLIEIESGEKTDICDKVSRFSYNDDTGSLFYLKNDKLYSYDSSSGKSDNIAKDVTNCWYTENGKLMYTALDKEYSVYDFIKDEYKDTDDEIKEPVAEDYYPDIEEPDYDDYDTYEEYDEAYDRYYDAWDKAREKYYEDYDKWEAVADRKELREELKDSDYKISTYSLYSYDGKESVMVCENIESADAVYDFSRIYDRDAVDAFSWYYEAFGLMSSNIIRVEAYKDSLSSMKKIDIDDVSSASGAYYKIEEELETKDVLVRGSDVIDIDKKNLEFYLAYSYDGDAYLYYIDEDDDDYTVRHIYLLDKDAKSMDDASLISKDGYDIAFPASGPVCFSDYDEKHNSATLSIGDEKINDVFPGWILYEDGDGFYYAKDFDDEDYTFDVYYYSNGESTKVTDDLLFFTLGFQKMDGKYLAIKDFDPEDKEGTLVCIDGDKEFEIDSGVKCIYNNSLKAGICRRSYEADNVLEETFYDVIRSLYDYYD